MKTIGEYQVLAEGISLEEYLAGDPPAVLLHHSALDALEPLGGAPGSTRNRLALTDSPHRRLPGAVPRGEAYTVFPLEDKTGRDRDEFLIGCGTASDVYLSDGAVSREHAWIERRGEGYFVRDNASTLGTRVNGTVIRAGEEHRLAAGDRVSLGPVDLLFLPPIEFFRFVSRFLAK